MIFKKVNCFRLPEKMYKGDAGYDCFVPTAVLIEPLQTIKIDLGFSVNLKSNECAQLVIRSSLAEEGLIVSNCIIDSNYMGTVHLVLHNISNKEFKYMIGSRLCSIVIYKIKKDNKHYLNRKRGNNCFGSSGR